MTIEGLTKVWPILEAFKDGKVVQYLHVTGRWKDIKPEGLSLGELFAFPERYRVKPEPREIWTVNAQEGGVWGSAVFPDRQDAEEFARRYNYAPPVKFREVID